MSLPLRRSERQNKGLPPAFLRGNKIIAKNMPATPDICDQSTSSLVTCIGFNGAGKSSLTQHSGIDKHTPTRERPSTSQSLYDKQTHVYDDKKKCKNWIDNQTYTHENVDKITERRRSTHTNRNFPHDMEVYNDKKMPKGTTIKKRTTCFSMNDVDNVRARQRHDAEIDFQRIDNWCTSTLFQSDKASSNSDARIFELENQVQKLTDMLQNTTTNPKNNCAAQTCTRQESEVNEEETRPSYLDLMTTFMARQSKMDLPRFDGKNPEDWPLFKNEYIRTTKVGKFTSGENVTRLRNALKDKAFEAVSSLLILPNSAEKVMTILERKYGRPDFIIKSLITKAKLIESPREDNPSSIINFATAVENLTVMIELLERPEYLANPQLIEELEGKLPPIFHILWSDSIYDKERYDLRDLSNWLDRKSHAASLRIPTDVLTTATKPPKRRTGRVNTATIKKDDEDKCPICTSNCKNVLSCKKFEEMTIDDRWKSATKASLCFSCLKRNHSTFECRQKIQCKVNNCKRFHNALLHSDRKAPLQNDISIKHPTDLCAHSSATDVTTKLRILPIFLKNNDVSIKTLAILDPGATLTLIRSDIADLLKTKGAFSPLSIKWFNGDLAEEPDSICFSPTIQGIHKGSKAYKLRNVRTVKKLPLVYQSIERDALIKKWPYLQKIEFKATMGNQLFSLAKIMGY